MILAGRGLTPPGPGPSPPSPAAPPPPSLPLQAGHCAHVPGGARAGCGAAPGTAPGGLRGQADSSNSEPGRQGSSGRGQVGRAVAVGAR